MDTIVLYNGLRAWCVDGVWYTMPTKIVPHWTKVNPNQLPVWLAIHMYG